MNCRTESIFDYVQHGGSRVENHCFKLMCCSYKLIILTKMSLGRLFNRLRLNFCEINSICFIYIYIYIYIYIFIKLSETFYLHFIYLSE